MDFAEFSTWSDGKETTEGASSTSAENIEAETSGLDNLKCIYGFVI